MLSDGWCGVLSLAPRAHDGSCARGGPTVCRVHILSCARCSIFSPEVSVAQARDHAARQVGSRGLTAGLSKDTSSPVSRCFMAESPSSIPSSVHTATPYRDGPNMPVNCSMRSPLVRDTMHIGIFKI